jgi:long-chain acyl-CoA synthetase
MIVLPNGFNVYPEDIENALRVAGLRDSVAIETRPGRIEAIVLRDRGSDAGTADAGADAGPANAATMALRARMDEIVKSANGHLGPNQRIAGWRLWPDDDFPRTHTLKIKRGPVREWAIAEAGPAAPAAPAGEAASA